MVGIDSVKIQANGREDLGGGDEYFSFLVMPACREKWNLKSLTSKFACGDGQAR